MEQNKTKIYLNYLSAEEKKAMTEYLSFLRTGKTVSKIEFINICKTLYSKDKQIELLLDNGHSPSGCCAKGYYVVIDFNRKDLTEQAIADLGSCDEWDWRYFYGIAFGKDDRELYIISYSNACSPNWNNEYNLHKAILIKDANFKILKEGCFIYRMDDALHGAINELLLKTKSLFIENDGNTIMMVKDQHGNFVEIVGNSVEEVFRDYADNYTGYRNYRRQMASEWEIVDEIARQRYEVWKQTAKGLKSDFDKFYGNGIVD